MLLIVGFVLTGCSLMPRWMPFARNEGSPQKASEATDQKTAVPWLGNHATKSADGRAAAGAVRVVHLGFELLRIDLPVGSIRHSRKVFNHVDELRAGPELAARLARNGIRVGAASSDAWPAIRVVLEAADARFRKEQLLPQGDVALVIELGLVEAGESIFRYDRDNRLVGKTFPGGMKRVNLDYAFHPGLGGGTDLRMTLEVRHDRGTMTWERRDGIIRQVPNVDRHLFEDLVATVTLNPAEFLIIGPGEQAGNEYLVGSRFFSYERAGERFEILLCITPQPYQTDRRGRERA